jgi:UrcA family protein
MKSKLLPSGMALAAGVLVGAGVFAQDMNEIVVESSPAHVERAPGAAGSTVHYDLISVKYAVVYSDLDLSTHSGAMELEHRINAAAKKGCATIDKQYPLAMPASDDKPCVKTAVDGAMAKAHDAIAAAEAKAKK